jgi:hypothetical protein
MSTIASFKAPKIDNEPNVRAVWSLWSLFVCAGSYIDSKFRNISPKARQNGNSSAMPLQHSSRNRQLKSRWLLVATTFVFLLYSLDGLH